MLGFGSASTSASVVEPKARSTAAGAAFQALFNGMKQKKWHEVRLIDATDNPINENNSPADDFEKAAVAAFAAGKPSPEVVVEQDGRRYLRIATPIPVVMDKCVLCHEHYKGNKGVIGLLGYKLPLVE